jgi:uncharacterized protein (DUF305 family)
MPSHPRSRAALVVAAVAACALASTVASSAQAQQTTPSSAPASAPASARVIDSIAAARADSIQHLYTAADVRFMTDMIGHHSQAIVMAKWAPSHGASSSVQILASRIINAQRDEIHTMQQWLRDRHLPVPIPDTLGTGMSMGMDSTGGMQSMSGTGDMKDTPAMSGMSGMSGMNHGAHPGTRHVMLMPGMLTSAQMRQLDAARGPAFDRLFLTYMMQHHRGALSMVQDLFGSYGAAQDDYVFKFASDVNVDQTTEIGRMQQMLAAILFATPGQ